MLDTIRIRLDHPGLGAFEASASVIVMSDGTVYLSPEITLYEMKPFMVKDKESGCWVKQREQFTDEHTKEIRALLEQAWIEKNLR